MPLATHVSHAVNRTAQLFKDSRIPLPTQHPGDFFPSQTFRASREPRIPIVDAESLAKVYQATTGFHSSVVASTFLFHFRAPGWFTTLNWKAFDPPGMKDFYAFSEMYALQLCPLDGMLREVQESIDEETRLTLQRVQQKYKALAFWEIFAISRESETVLQEMDHVASLKSFHYKTCQTKECKTPPIMVLGTCDASMTSWGVPVSTLLTTPTPEVAPEVPEKLPVAQDRTAEKGEPLPRKSRTRHSEVIRKRSKKKLPGSVKEPLGTADAHSHLWPTVELPAPVSKSTEARGITDLFIQRAWARSVEHDTTYIVFYCGNFERIGFRHRKSQTLFLSDLIHVPQCKNPAYGKIHIGLYLSIMQDAIDRAEQHCKRDEELQSTNRKRRRATAIAPSHKRYKTRAMVLKARREAEECQKNCQVVKQEAEDRSLALLELRYGIYNSPAPASFIRLNRGCKATYAPHEYLSLVLTSRIAAGATGVAHEAYMELLASDGTNRRLDVVVKLAFEPEQTTRLRHEFSIYEHLASHGVLEGIPIIYGLFEDVESDALTLVMSNVGTALATLIPDDRSYGTAISEPVRAGYLRVLTAIHAAGVRHRDIRPENLMFTDDDQVAIIDFDMAELDPSEGAKRREMRHMLKLLDGTYVPPNEYPSAATTPDKHGTSRPVTVLESVVEEGDRGSQ